MDHTLLMEYLDEKSEVELIAKTSGLALLFKKKYKAMVIYLGQLNDKVEQPERLKNPLLHYPTKTDIHGSKSVYHVSDTIIIIHRPELLNIQTYGRKNYPTKDLITLHVVKSRLSGMEGIIRMKQDYEHGTLHEWVPYEDKEQTKLPLKPS